MALESAKSLTTGTAQAIKSRYYDTLFLRNAEQNLVHKQLGQMSKKIGKGEGGYGTGVLYWTRWERLPLVTVGQGEGYPTTAIPLTAVNVTGSTAQYDQAVSISDILAYVSFGDVMKEAVELLAYNAGLSIDTIVRNAISTGMTVQNATGLAAANWTAIPVTGTLNMTEIKKSVRTLRRNNARTLDDGYFAAVIHSDALYDLMVDTSTGGWIDANKYTEPNAQKLMRGEVGKLAGVRFLETSNGYVRNTGVTASGSIYVTSVFGKDAFGVSELQNLRTYIKGFGSGGTGDPTEKIATAGWKAAFGVTVLNSAFGVNIHHTVSSTA